MYIKGHPEISKRLLSGQYTKLLDELKTKPESPFYKIMNAYCYSKLGYEKKATEILKDNYPKRDPAAFYHISELMIAEIKVSTLVEIDFEQQKQKLKDMSDIEYRKYLEAYYLLLEAMHYNNLSQNNKSIDILKDLASLNFDFDPSFPGKIFHHIGYAYRNLSEYENAIEYYHKSLKIRRKLKNFTEIADTLNHIAVSSGLQNDIEKAEKMFLEVIQMRDVIDDSKVYLRTLNNLGIISKWKGDYEESIAYYRESISISESRYNYLDLRSSYYNVGNLKIEQSMHPEAISWFQKALDVKEVSQSDKLTANIFSSLGLVHKRLGLFRKADYYYSKAKEIIILLEEPLIESVIRGNIANLLSTRGELAEAIYEFNIAIDLINKTSNLNLQSNILTDLGNCFAKYNDYNRSLKSLTQALEIRRKIGNDHQTSITLYHLLQLEISNHNPNSVEILLNEFKKIALKTDNRDVLSRFNIIQTIILQQSDDTSNQIQGSELIEEILSGEYVSFEVSTSAMIAYCEYTMIELSHNSSVETLDTLAETVEKLYILATNNESHELIAKTLIIQAKIALGQNDHKRVALLLHEIREINNHYDLRELDIQISYLESQMDSFSDPLSESNQLDLSQKYKHLELLNNFTDLYKSVEK